LSECLANDKERDESEQGAIHKGTSIVASWRFTGKIFQRATPAGSSLTLFSAAGFLGNLIIGEVVLIIDDRLDHFADVRPQ
jgi:hypothetical protein